jgi:hypothetical protein
MKGKIKMADDVVVAPAKDLTDAKKVIKLVASAIVFGESALKNGKNLSANLDGLKTFGKSLIDNASGFLPGLAEYKGLSGADLEALEAEAVSDLQLANAKLAAIVTAASACVPAAVVLYQKGKALVDAFKVAAPAGQIEATAQAQPVA